MTAATCGLSRIRHTSLTMPGEGGLQSTIATRRAASQRRNYKSETEDLEVVVFTFMPLAERPCRQIQPPADMMLQSSRDRIYQKLLNGHVRILKGFTISSEESRVQKWLTHNRRPNIANSGRNASRESNRRIGDRKNVRPGRTVKPLAFDLVEWCFGIFTILMAIFGPPSCHLWDGALRMGF